MRLIKDKIMIRVSVIILLLLLAGCNVPLLSIKPTKLPPDRTNGPYFQANNYVIDPLESEPSTDSITVQYLGCGGLYIRKNQQAFLVDPFFSNVKMLPGLKLRLRRLVWLAALARRNVKIKPHTNSIDAGYELITRQTGYTPPKAILVTHGHYDHLLDVPYIHQTKFPEASAPIIYSNLTSANLLQNIIEKERLQNMEPGMQNQHNTGTWQIIGDASASEHIRFMAIEADHAPHAKSVKLFDGDGLHSIANYAAYRKGTPINEWLEGRTLNYLVDFMKGKDDIAFRMFIQTSACTPTRGLLSAALKKEKSVDLAVICVASFELVDQYPNLLLKHLEPQHVMLVHWEDFIFKSYEKNLKNPKTIGFSNVGAFICTMQETRSRYGLKYRYSMPAPGVRATVKFGGIKR